MKEYKTMRVDPSEEVDTIEALAVFGWKLEESKEIYNESDEIVGVNVDTKVKTYGDGFIGGFMAGWNGDEGKVQQQVTYETRKNVTHYVSMRFSRETSSKNYVRLKELELEYYQGAGCKSYFPIPRKPVALTVIASIALAIIIISLCTLFVGAQAEIWEIVVCVVVPVVFIPLLIVFWMRYSKKNKIAVEENRKISEYNAEREQAFAKRTQEIVDECVRLNEENDK
ncbi:MAG: hypothetical protein K2O28_02205 [Clostridia bacterium]|nr:hypothetical protein [Clostridia bacterium]